MEEATKAARERNPFARASHVHFTQRPSEKERERSDPSSTCWRAYPKWVVSGSALVIVISLTLQAGPLLTEFAISHGMERHKSLSVIVVCAVLLPRPRVSSVSTSNVSRFNVNGASSSSRVMHDPPHSIFTQFPATQPGLLSPKRRAGVLMKSNDE